MNQIQLKESKPHYTRASKQFANHQVNTAEIPKRILPEGRSFRWIR